MRSLLVLAALLAIPFVIGTAVGFSPERGDEVFSFQDPAIVESSGLVALGDGLFVTTNDGNVFALAAGTGRVLWQYKPRDSALFKNFGIVANRGLAFCAGRLFLARLDMKLVALRPGDGRVLATTSIADDVPGALPNNGYSETSAPVCAGGRVVIGAAGSEYGTRGFVMAYTTDLVPAWPNPYWTIPPEQQSWRAASRVVGGGNVWTPVTVDTSTDTVFFGTGSATPLRGTGPMGSKATAPSAHSATTWSETSTWPGPAWAAIRAARLTVRPK